MKLTVAIPTKNEEKNLDNCLQSIGKEFADRVVIIDSNSEDGTVKIAVNWGAEVVSFYWNGMYPKKRNWFIENHCQQDEWVLFLDADELLTENFKHEVKQKICNKLYSGFWINYRLEICTKELRFGYPLKKLSLIKIGSGLYEYIPENNWSNLDMEVHEHPIINGKVSNISSPLKHKVDFFSENWKEKHLQYAKWEANRIRSQINRMHFDKLTNPQKIKYLLIKTPFIGIAFFLGNLFLFLGILDGMTGIRYAYSKAKYFGYIRKELLK